ncbi:YcbK family protein [Pararhizobium sp.]|uniref:YcbK family protein n=1 Tax=Pararhizobium sp. TaxID=1977563 RepID=UPI00271CF3E3|nr:D-Ala-D-Ala carboxypeptidase family metallohydrolase [Pararhizobium sp.]MDO9415381.1 D-Ala-D-Ala carboxypeptidase family metallohydrolase [Pararhizobium sp.]
MIAASLFVLSGCVSATSDQALVEPLPTASAAATAEADPSQQSVPAGENAVATASDVSGQQQQQQADAAANATAQQSGQVPLGDASQLAALTMQPNGVKANSSSIYAVQSPTGEALPETAVGSDGETYTSPSRVPLPGFNTAKRSLYQADPEAAADVPLTAQQDQQVAAVATTDQQRAGLEPLAGEQAVADDAQRQEMIVLPVNAEQQAAANAAENAQAVPTSELVPEAAAEEEKRPKKFTLASFFGGKKKQEKKFNKNRFGEQAATRTISVENPAAVQTASLTGTDLPGVKVNSMFATTTDEPAFAGGYEDENDGTKPVEIAALPGLARLAPNGLWMQTERVESGCFKPELLTVLKGIERHYGRKLMVTSGFRGEKSNRRKGGVRHSLHTVCAAADIQIAGVGKWELAAYLRTMPNRGGVGTYCHTESVHIDIGDPRDWNWRCRRRK